MPGLVPTPTLTLTITPPGGSPTDYSSYLAFAGADNSLTINQQFGRQGDTAVIPLVDDWQGAAHPRIAIPVLSQISLNDSVTGNLFAGVATNPALHPIGANINEWALNCTDYTFYADNAIVQGVFSGLTIDQIVILLTAQANCGITAGPTSLGGFVAPAPAIAQATFNWMTLSSAWRKLAQLASSSTPYGWYVDQSRRLHFFDSSTAVSSGVTFRGDLPTAAAANGSYTEGHVTLDSTAGYEVDGASIRNRIIVQGANQTITTLVTGNPTDTWRADGTQASWPLRYTVTGTPTLQVGGAFTPVTVVGAGGTAPASGWSVQQNAFGQYFLISASTPSAGTVIKIWYNYQIPVVAQANDYPSQSTYTGPNNGVFTEFIQDTSLLTTSMALARAQRERTEYAFAAERITFTTSEDFLGYLRAGQTFMFTSPLINDPRAGYNPPSWGLTGTFLCVSNSVAVGGGGVGGYRKMSVTAVRI